MTVAVGGFESNSGKTTLLCDLLRAFPGWEAIKVTRGHYRSCGKDPQACCVSPLLGAEPLIRTGHAETYAPGKDTGRYWDAGASNVHWVIATDGQVEEGISEALGRVKAPGVFIEGNSYLKFIEVDFAVMVTLGGGQRIKPSARRVMAKVSALYVSREEISPANGLCEETRRGAGLNELEATTPVFALSTFAQLVEDIRQVRAEKIRHRQ